MPAKTTQNVAKLRASRADIANHLLSTHRHLIQPVELNAIRVARILPILHRTKGANRMMYEKFISDRGPDAVALATYAKDDLLGIIADRVLSERAAEVWLNCCRECGALARTGVARQCRHCGHSWHHTPRFHWNVSQATLKARSLADRVVVGHVEDLGLVVCLADGAGNSSAGVQAANLVVARAKEKLWPAETNHWDLQELLLECDDPIRRLGAESTALLIVVREHEVCAAACGDSLLFGANALAPWHFPSPRTRRRLGSGNPDVAVFSHAFQGALALATDGATASIGIGELRAQLASPDHETPRASWLSERLESRVAEVGDDSTIALIRLTHASSVTPT